MSQPPNDSSLSLPQEAPSAQTFDRMTGPTMPVPNSQAASSHSNQVFAPPSLLLVCTSCIAKAANPYRFKATTPGPLFRLPCNHIQCRTCMTEHQFSKGDMTAYLTCSICDHAAGFPLDQRPLLSVHDLSRMSAHLIQIRDLQILNVHSPHFAARDAILVGRPLASNVLKAVSALVSSQYHARGGDISVQGISSQGILQVIDRHLTGMDPVRLVTSELLHAELEIFLWTTSCTTI